MKVILMGRHNISSVTLPKEIRGQYKIEELQRDGSRREVHIEAEKGKWVIKNSDMLTVTSQYVSENRKENFVELEENRIYNITFSPSMEKGRILVEPEGSGSNFYEKYSVPEDGRIFIGNKDNVHVCYKSPFISKDFLISITYSNQEIVVRDEAFRIDQKAGNVYLNGRYMEQAIVHYGDVLYFFGLKIIFGRNFISMNNPGFFVKCNLQPFILPYVGNQKRRRSPFFHSEEKYFSSSPKKERSIKPVEIIIQNPPKLEKEDDTPIYLIMGPALTMASASAVTGAFSIMSTVQNNGNIMQAIPSLVMMGSIMIGSVICPVFSRRYTSRKRKKQNSEHYNRYSRYIEKQREEIRILIQQQTAKLCANYPTLIQCENRISGREPSLWERSIGDCDFLDMGLGYGEDEIRCSMKYPEENLFEAPDEITELLNEFKNERKMLDQVPITFSLREHALTGIIGSRELTRSFMLGLILQMVALHSYDDLKIGVVYGQDEPEWECLKWLPHTWSNDRMIKFMADTLDEMHILSSFLELIRSMRSSMSDEELAYEKPHYVLILADQKLAEKSEFIKDLYRQRKSTGISLVLLFDEKKALPKTCRHVLEVDEQGVTIHDYTDDDRQEKRADNSMFFRENPEQLFKSLSDVKLDVVAGKSTFPEQLTLFEMLEIGKPQHMDFINRWEKSNPTKTLAVPIGVDSEGNTIYLDIHEKAHGPHGLIAGSTGSGKSEFIISYITMMALNFSPEEVSFILIDFKGGGMADVFKSLPHLAGSITNLDGNELNRSLLAIETELERRQLLFKTTSNELKISNVDIYRYQQLYREGQVKKPLPHLIIISDEFAELKQQQPEFLQQLIRTARIGRSLGVHLILATQKPDGVVDDQIKSNIKFKICLRVQDKMDSISMIDRPDAAAIRVPGRFYLLVGMNELFEQGQSPFSGAEYEESDAAIQKVDDTVVVFNGLDRISIKPKSGQNKGSSEKQVDVLLRYMSQVCEQNQYRTRTLWREQLPGPKMRKEKTWSDKQEAFVINPIVGRYDDLRNQKYCPLTVPLTDEGNALIYGVAGSGTLEFINSMVYFLIQQHSPEELQMYLLDYEAGSLHAFDHAPQVAAVYQGYQEKQIDMMLDSISNEIVVRKKMFSRYGGNYQNFIRNSGKKVPNLVVFLLNCAVAFEDGDSYDRMQKIIQLSREGSQYGLYFVLTAVDDRSIRSQLSSNFKQIFVLQQNKEDEYRDILGKTDGMVPAPYLGRGIFKRGQYIYEFQTDILFEEAEDPYEEIEKFCLRERKQYGYIVEEEEESIPEVVILSEDDFYEEWGKQSCEQVPLGSSQDGKKLCWDLTKSGKQLIVIESSDHRQAAELLMTYIQRICPDTEIWTGTDAEEEMIRRRQGVDVLYQETLHRGEIGLEALKHGKTIPDFRHKVIIIDDYDDFVRCLENSQYFRLDGMLKKISPVYHIHLIMVNPLEKMSSPFNRNIWDEQTDSGIWFGNLVRCTGTFQLTDDIVEYNQEDVFSGALIQKGHAIGFRLPERSKKDNG